MCVYVYIVLSIKKGNVMDFYINLSNVLALQDVHVMCVY